jgi:hypothetical protein
VSFPEIVKMESKVPFRVKMESLQKTTSGIFSRKFYYGSPGAAIGFSAFSANSSTLQGMCMSDVSIHLKEATLLPFLRAVYLPKILFNHKYSGLSLTFFNSVNKNRK